jgi:hypothetical protein
MIPPKRVIAAMVVLFAVLTMPTLRAQSYQADTATEEKFKDKLGEYSHRIWADDLKTLRSLTGETKVIDGAYESPLKVKSALSDFIGVSTQDLLVDANRTFKTTLGAHYEYHQTIGLMAIENAGVYVDVSPDDRIIGVAAQTVRDIKLWTSGPVLSKDAGRCFAAAVFLARPANCDALPPAAVRYPAGFDSLQLDATLTLYAVPPFARWAWAVELSSENPHASRRYVIDAKGGFVLEMRDRVHHSGPHGRIFNPSPFTDPTVKTFADVGTNCTAYEEIDPLPELSATAAGDFVLSNDFVTVNDFQKHADFSDDFRSADGSFDFDRGTAQFASVMAFYHITKLSERAYQFPFMTKPKKPLSVDVRRIPFSFTSDYTNSPPGEGFLLFGFRHKDGNVFQAEDGDVVAHEYGHAIQAGQALGRYDNGTNPQTPAMYEGFGDYWAISYFQTAKSAHGLTSTCLGEWIHRSSGGAGCDRTVDPSATIADYDPAKDAHVNAAVWTAVLLEIRQQLGEQMADALILRSHYSVPDGPSFSDGARAILTADKELNAAAPRADALCVIFEGRGLLTNEDCKPLPAPP